MLFSFSIFLYILVGSGAGLLGALLGIGGGILTVPALFVIFSLMSFPQADLMKIAIGTSLASMVINTLGSAFFHNQKKHIVWKAIKRIFPGIVIGCFFGVFLARELSSNILQMIFGVFACILGIFFIKPIKKIDQAQKIPSYFIFTLIGIGIASLANLLGLGGGFFILPILLYFHFNGKEAIGTSSAVSFLITLGGALGYLISAKSTTSIPGCIGYIYIPAFIAIGLSSLFTSPYGVKLSHTLPINLIRRFFAILVICAGLFMIFK
jgi:uncharacterized protein